MKTCFVSMPVGVKTDPMTGVVVDFDRVFAEVVSPAVERAQLSMRSWRSVSIGTSIQKETLGHIMTSDILLADITTANANVMYELGIRHASNRGPTVLIRAALGQPPFYVGLLQTIMYDPAEDLSHSEALRSRITEALRSAARRSEGSPVYEFFPGLRVELPADLGSLERPAKAYPERVQQKLTNSRSATATAKRADVAQAEEALKGSGDAPPAVYLDILRGYRDASDWDRLIRFGASLPTEVESDPQALQLVALALNRRSEPGDQDRAVALMRKLVDETGGDAEAFGILGRILKARWQKSGDPAELAEAITCYRRSFELQPSDYYSGFNAIALLFLQDQPAADGEVAALLPRVKDALQPRLTADQADYWVLSTAIEIAVIERHWEEAMDLLSRALALKPSPWMRSASVDSLQRLGSRLTGEDAGKLASIVESLGRGAEQEDDEYA